jgi:ABC-type transport system involved in Fe-S cluster assembly fused permease/ATPase subunit
MLSNLVGQVDFNAAFVLVAAIVCACVVVTTLIERRSRIDVSNEFELAKMKQEAENARALYVVETDRAYKFKQVESGLITSHHREQ